MGLDSNEELGYNRQAIKPLSKQAMKQGLNGARLERSTLKPQALESEADGELRALLSKEDGFWDAMMNAKDLLFFMVVGEIGWVCW